VAKRARGERLDVTTVRLGLAERAWLEDCRGALGARGRTWACQVDPNDHPWRPRSAPSKRRLWGVAPPGPTRGAMKKSIRGRMPAVSGQEARTTSRVGPRGDATAVGFGGSSVGDDLGIGRSVTSRLGQLRRADEVR
jgi:hypothetical protein